jgi:hypothetical protein
MAIARSEGFISMKNSTHTIWDRTFWFVAQYLNHWATAVPLIVYVTILNVCIPNLFDPRAHLAFYFMGMVFLPGVKWPGRDTDHSSSDEVKNGKDTKIFFGR